MRSLSYNLRDASNPELRARVLQGEVTPDRLVQMTPAEMASKVSAHNLHQLSRKESLQLRSNHDRSLQRRQPGASCQELQQSNKQCVDLLLHWRAASQALRCPQRRAFKAPAETSSPQDCRSQSNLTSYGQVIKNLCQLAHFESCSYSSPDYCKTILAHSSCLLLPKEFGRWWYCPCTADWWHASQNNSKPAA